MDAKTTAQRFRQAFSLASLAYIFSIIHTIQYEMRHHLQSPSHPPLPSGNPTTSTSGPSSLLEANTTNETKSTSTSEKTASNRWTDEESFLLLDYVEKHCVLTTARGTALKKRDFNKAHDAVKTKSANQCHYKWTQVIFFIMIAMSLDRLSVSY